MLEILDASGSVVTSNNDWSTTNLDEMSAITSATHAFPLKPASKDAALALTLSPGVYTVRVSGAGGSSGVALVEIYEVP